jgi:hypothetical protein
MGNENYLEGIEAIKGGGKPELAVLEGEKGMRAGAGGATEEDLKDLTDEQKRLLWFVFVADGGPQLKLIR